MIENHLPISDKPFILKAIRERVDKIDNDFPNFQSSMQDLYKMENTFGLCGIISLVLCGIWDGKWVWGDEKLDFHEILKDFNDTIAELKANTKSKRETPLNRFLRQSYPRIVESGQSIINPNSVETILWDAWSRGLQVRVAVMCKYPNLSGEYTHWLSVLGFVEYCMAVGGDLTPFGIRDRYVVAVKQKDFSRLLVDVIGKKATTKGSEQLRVGFAYSKDKKGDVFINNLKTIDFSRF